jgi:2'-5' RNA ligase
MHGTELIRTFVGVPLTGEAREAVVALQDRYRRGLRDERVVKWERLPNLHVTLQFLGDTPRGRLDDISRAIARVVASRSPFELVLARPDAFGGRQPRVLVVKTGRGADALAALQAELSVELEGLGFEPERRAYSPHLTFGRVRRDRQLPRAEAERLAAETAEITTGAAMSVAEIVHFESTLGPEGATYSRLCAHPLGGVPAR